jgi:hypothetical protein
MNVRFALTFILLLSLQSMPSYADDAYKKQQNAQEVIDSLECIIKQSSYVYPRHQDRQTPADTSSCAKTPADTEADVETPLGLTLKGTLDAALSDGLMYATGYYLWGAITKRTSPELTRINEELEPLEALIPTQENVKLFGTLFAQYAGADIAYAGVRVATKEITGYDAAPVMQTSIQAITVQTIGNYLAPDDVKLFTHNQVASYVATDVTVAASMYAYKEITGKKLVCPPLPIPDALRQQNINEKLIGTGIYAAAKIALRTMVMNKLCGVPAP